VESIKLPVEPVETDNLEREIPKNLPSTTSTPDPY